MSAKRPEQAPGPDPITRLGRLIGLGGIVYSTVYWSLTQHVSNELLGVFLGLWGMTEAGAAVKGLRRK